MAAIVDVPTISTERLDLVSISPEWIEAQLSERRDAAAEISGLNIPDSWPDERERYWLRIRDKAMRDGAEPQEWLMRAIGNRLTNEMLGRVGFHGSPVDEVAEIGYTVFEPHRRNGYAEESVRGLMEWAQEIKAVCRFRLSIGPDNQPSLQLASKLGFTKTGDQMDELDGLEYVFDLDLR